MFASVIRRRGLVSGRLTKCIPIGYRREDKRQTYWLRDGLYKAWGGVHFMIPKERTALCLQRSAVLPQFSRADEFMKWFEYYRHQHDIRLISENNQIET
jgi:hypothetical protein